jgi:hypothetical protein
LKRAATCSSSATVNARENFPVDILLYGYMIIP